MREKRNIADLATIKPDMMGFIFYPPSSRFVGAIFDVAITEHIDEAISRVGVFVNESIEKVLQIRDQYGLDFVQLHGDESVNYCEALHDKDVQLIKVFSVGEHFDFSDLEAYEPYCSYFLFDTKGPLRGGNGRQFDWSVLQAYSGDLPIILSGGIGPQDVPAILEAVASMPAIQAIDVNSGFELAPAQKDIPALSRFFTKIRK